ncbi:MAG: hypothetical protein AAGD06_31110 [Acidobacteriota bacterium]
MRTTKTYRSRRDVARPIQSVNVLLTALMALAAGAAQAGDTAVVHPDHGSPGTEIEIQGTSFTANADDYVAFVYAPATDTGAVFDLVEATPDRLRGVLDSAPSTVTGRLHLWRGERIDLGSRLVETPSGTFLVRRAEVFLGRQLIDAGPFHVLGDTQGDVSTRSAPNSLILKNTEPWFKIDQGIDLANIVDCGIGPPSDDPDGLFVTATNLQKITGTGVERNSQTVADLATVLNGVFGPMGLKYSASGPDLVIATEDPKCPPLFALADPTPHD